MKIPWRREWLPTPTSLPGEVQGQRSLGEYSAWGPKELDMTEWLTLSNRFNASFWRVVPFPWVQLAFNSLLWGAVLMISLAAILASTHWMPVISSSPLVIIQTKCPLEAKITPLENHYCQQSRPMARSVVMNAIFSWAWKTSHVLERTQS